jgi:hypothetical protein
MTNVLALKTSDRIRILNDNFRSTFIGGQVRALIEVQKFSNFTADNDLYGEHDFGSFDLAGEKFFWKIDYYDSDMTSGSEDPSDPEKTTRVLTIMFADEY